MKKLLITLFLCFAYLLVQGQTWEELNQEGINSYHKGDYDNALIFWEKAVSQAKKDFGKVNNNYALSLNNLAALYYKIGNYQKAAPLFLDALKITEKVLGKKHPEYALSLNNLAALYYKMGSYQKAEPLYLEALKIRENVVGKKHPEYAKSLNDLAILYDVMGNYRQAEILFLEALKIREESLGKRHPDYATSLNSLTLLYSKMGNYQQAEILFLETLKIREEVLGKRHPDYAVSLNSLAFLYSKMGNYQQAEILFLETLKIREEVLGKRHPDYANSLNNLASLYYQMNNYPQTESLFLEALKIREETLGRKHPDYAHSLNNLALLYNRIGNYQQAESLFLEALKIREETLGRKHPDYIQSLNNLATLYNLLGDYEGAESLLLEVLKSMEEVLGKKHPNYTIALNNLAFTYQLKDNYPQAESLFLEAIQRKSNQIENLILSLSESERKSYIESIQFFFENFYIFAIKYYKQKPEIAAQLLNLQLIIKALIFQSTQKMQEQILSSNNETLIKEYELWKIKRGDLARAIQMSKTDLQKAGIDLETLQKETNQLEKELSQKSTELSGFLSLTEIKWQDVQAKLKKDEALVEIIRLRTYRESQKDIVYVALILTSNTPNPQLILLENGQELENKYKNYYSNKIKRQQEDKYSYNQYWQPLKPYLKGIEKVYFSPDGVYHQINLLTLQNSETKEYLINEVKIQLLGSPKDLINLETEKQNLNFKDYQIYLFGYPQYSNFPYEQNNQSETAKNFAFENLLNNNESLKAGTILGFINTNGKISVLEGTLKEINNIFALVVNQAIEMQKFIELEASEENIKKLKSPTILHIATHGFFLKNLPKQEKNKSDDFRGISKNKFVENPLLRSGLLLAGAERTWQGEKTRGEDGILTAEEVIMIDLSGTDLVVLSACETGLGEINNNEGVYGLQRAFQQAGAKSVLMSLWKVSDNATQKMMSYFYENLLVKKQFKREAFRNAQLKLKEEFPNPFYWGAFVLIGE